MVQLMCRPLERTGEGFFNKIGATWIMKNIRSSYQKNITPVSVEYLEVNSFWSRGRRSSINLTLPPRFLSTYCQCSPPGHQSRRRKKLEHDNYIKGMFPNDVQKSFFNCLSPFCPVGQLGPAVPQPSLSGPGFCKNKLSANNFRYFRFSHIIAVERPNPPLQGTKDFNISTRSKSWNLWKDWVFHHKIIHLSCLSVESRKNIVWKTIQVEVGWRACLSAKHNSSAYLNNYKR